MTDDRIKMGIWGLHYHPILFLAFFNNPYSIPCLKILFLIVLVYALFYSPQKYGCICCGVTYSYTSLAYI